MIIIIIYFLTMLLPSIIHGNNEAEILEHLNRMAEQNQSINNVFILSERGHLGSGSYGFTYKGILNPPNIEVAVKFTSSEYEAEATREFEIYSYLNAVKNSSVEAFGIPSLHYCGRWNDYILMAFSLLDSGIKNKSDVNNVDLMIIFREFVRISKYIHSRGICHNDIKFDNLMFRKNEGFIIDYNRSFKMYETNGSVDVLSFEELEEGKGYAKKDWQCFIALMCRLAGIKFNFYIPESDEPFEMLMKDHLSINAPATMESLEKIDHPGLRKVFIEFAKHAFEIEIKIIEPSEDINGIRHKYRVMETIPFYDQVYNIINAEIENYGHEKPVLISWLSQQDKRKLRDYLVRNISSINDPFGSMRPKYSEVDYNFFRGQSDDGFSENAGADEPPRKIRKVRKSGKKSKLIFKNKMKPNFK